MKSSIEKINKKLKSVNKKLTRLFAKDYDSLVELKNGHYIAYEPLDSTSKNVLKRFRLEREKAKLTVLDKLQGYYVENLWYAPIYVGDMDEAITQTAKVTYPLGKIRNKNTTLELIFPLSGSGNNSFEWDSTILIARLKVGDEVIEQVFLTLGSEWKSLSAMFSAKACENTKLNLILFNTRATGLYPAEALELVDKYVACFSRVENINVEDFKPECVELEGNELRKEGKELSPMRASCDKCMKHSKGEDSEKSFAELDDDEEEMEEDLEFYAKLHKQARSSPKKEEKPSKHRSGVDINRLINRKRRVL